MKRTKSWATRRKEKKTTNSVKIEQGRANSNNRRNGAPNHRKVDFIDGVAMAVEFNLNSAEPDSVTSSKRFSVAAAAVRLSADLADVRRLRSAAPTSRPTSWLLWKKR